VAVGELCILFFFGLVLILGIVFVAKAIGSRSRDVRGRVVAGTDLPEIAGALGGIIERSPTLEFPYVQFVRNKLTWFFLHWYHPTTGVSGAALEVKRGSEGTLEAISVGSIRFPATPPRMRMIRELDLRFRFFTNDPAWAEQLLSRGLYEKLVDLADWMEVPIRLQLTLGHLMVEVDRILYPQGVQGLVDFLEFLLTLLGETPMTILESEEDTTQGTCQVCGSSLGEPVVRCARCRTAHHADCWEYLGGCATFGCGSRGKL